MGSKCRTLISEIQQTCENYNNFENRAIEEREVLIAEHDIIVGKVKKELESVKLNLACSEAESFSTRNEKSKYKKEIKNLCSQIAYEKKSLNKNAERIMTSLRDTIRKYEADALKTRYEIEG